MKTQIKHELRLYIEKSCQELQILKKKCFLFPNPTYSIFYFYNRINIHYNNFIKTINNIKLEIIQQNKI